MRKLILLIAVLMSYSLTGCGNKNEVSGEKKEEAKQELKKVEAPVNKEENKTTEAGEELAKSNELGMTPGMPSDFPADIPQPKNSKTLGSLTSSEGTMVTFETPDKVMDIVNFYKDEMKKNGYAIVDEGESQISDKGAMINWKKESKLVNLVLARNEEKQISSLVITYK